jgi:sec-independent protein translocase protein TatC
MRKRLRAAWRIIRIPYRLIRWLILAIVRGVRNAIHEIYDFFTFEEEDTPLGEAVASAVSNPLGLFEHLNALRRHLMRAAFVMIITTAISFTFVRQTMDFLARPQPGGIAAMRSIEPTESVGTVMWVALLLGFAMAFPYIALELWMFVAPGLSRRMRVWGLLSIPIALVFLLSGMAFVYFLMLPVALQFLTSFMGIKTQMRPSSYFKFVTNLMFYIGLAFEFPLVIFLLAKVGLIRARVLAKQWRFAIVIIAVVAAVITPTVDPINMSIVMAPMITLYFLSIFLAYIARRDRDPNEETMGDRLRKRFLS